MQEHCPHKVEGTRLVEWSELIYSSQMRNYV